MRKAKKWEKTKQRMDVVFVFVLFFLVKGIFGVKHNLMKLIIYGFKISC